MEAPSVGDLQRDHLDDVARALEATGRYRVLRRLVSRPVSPPAVDGSEKVGLVIDVETTGLDHTRDEVIELAMLAFRYRHTGEITGISATFQAFNEPSHPIPGHITKLTGITDAMVAGHKIDTAAVESFVADAGIVIAHYADFDRKFAERAWPIFAHKAWACSATEVDWKAHGYSGAKLSYLATEAGFFYSAHRAIDDCRAVLELLGSPLGTSTTSLALLLDRAQRKTCRIRAEYSPYDLKDVLKSRGYRWNNGADGSLGAWYIDVDEDHLDAELKFLRQKIYQRDVDLYCVEYSAFERFSARTGVGRARSPLLPKSLSDA